MKRNRRAESVRDRERRGPARPRSSAAPNPWWARLSANQPLWASVSALSLVALLWACRGAPFGVPVADDYDFLYWLRFQPFRLLDSMGTTTFWRPLGRQVYFLIIQNWLFSAPCLVSALQCAMLAATSWILFRIARRTLSPPLAAAAASFPLLAEPVRVLVVWPSGGQHLMAILFAALAIHEGLRLRVVTAYLAAALALLCHEAAAIVLVGLPLVAAMESRSIRRALPWVAVSAAVGAAWFLLHSSGQTRGTHFLPANLAGGHPFRDYLVTLWRILLAQLNLEEWSGGARTTFLVAYGGIFGALALISLVRWTRRGRGGERAWAETASGAIAWLLACALPLSFLSNQWQSWRSCFAGMWLGIPLFLWLGSANAWLAGAFVVLRLAALLWVAPPPTIVTDRPPESVSSMSLARVVRLQRTADSARRALLDRFPTLPHGASVRYWARASLTEVGFEAEKAVRVWYSDSTIAWGWFWERLDRPASAVLSFESKRTNPVVLLEPEAVRLMQEAVRTYQESRFHESDSLLFAAERAQVEPSPQFSYWLLRQHARSALYLRQPDRADSLNRLCIEMAGETADTYGMTALIAASRGDAAQAEEAARRALQLDPRNDAAQRALRALNAMRGKR